MTPSNTFLLEGVACNMQKSMLRVNNIAVPDSQVMKASFSLRGEQQMAVP